MKRKRIKSVSFAPGEVSFARKVWDRESQRVSKADGIKMNKIVSKR